MPVQNDKTAAQEKEVALKAAGIPTPKPTPVVSTPPTPSPTPNVPGVNQAIKAKIARMTDKERDMLAETLARRQRIDKLEKIQRSLRNKRHYEKRMHMQKEADEDLELRTAMNNEYNNTDMDDDDTNANDNVSSCLSTKNFFIGGVGLCAVAAFLLK